jgi:hypothetical protein
MTKKQTGIQPRYYYEGDQLTKYKCTICGSSLKIIFLGIRINKCINPRCNNYHKRKFI